MSSTLSFALDSQELAETYDRVSDRQFQHGLELLAPLGLGPGLRVLDVGCGTGRLSAHVASLVGPLGRVIGIDPLPLRVELAKRKTLENLRAELGVAEDLSRFADASFDVVLMNSVFHWLPEKKKPLAEAERVLASGGRIAISSAIADHPHEFELILREAVKNAASRELREVRTGTLHKVRSEELHALLVEAGFSDVVVEVRSIIDHFTDKDEVVTFFLASSFGNFLAELSREERALAESLLERALEERRTPQGIRLQRNLAFAIGSRR